MSQKPPSYLALARKWRPQTFDEVLGQTHIVQALKNACLYDRVAPAYVFSGTRGVGKTSLARIFAKNLCCPNAQKGNACGKCPACLGISQSQAADVIELDGASHNGVDDIRSLTQSTTYRPLSGKYKVYIIDEAHMLSTSAFNALLKTLEEPPSHVVFILATTEIESIPPTVLSRAQRLEFQRLTEEQIMDQLGHILDKDKENIPATQEALHFLAKLGDGSLRDALSLLDQVISISHDKASSPSFSLTESLIAESLGISDPKTIASFAHSLFKGDIPTLLTLIEETANRGCDLSVFATNVLEYCRKIYFLALSREEKNWTPKPLLSLTEEEKKQIEDDLKHHSLFSVERILQLLSQLTLELGKVRLPQFLFEVTSIRMAKIRDFLESNKPVEIHTQKISSKNVAQEIPSFSSNNLPSWKDIISNLSPKKPTLSALLSHVSYHLERTPSGHLSVTLSAPQNSFYASQLMDPKNKREIELSLSEALGPKLQLTITASPQSPIPLQKSLSDQKQDLTEQAEKEALKHPMVTKIQQTLSAEVVQVRHLTP